MGHLLGYTNDLKKHLTTNDHFSDQHSSSGPIHFGDHFGEIQRDWSFRGWGNYMKLPAEILRDQEPFFAATPLTWFPNFSCTLW